MGGAGTVGDTKVDLAVTGRGVTGLESLEAGAVGSRGVEAEEEGPAGKLAKHEVVDAVCVELVGRNTGAIDCWYKRSNVAKRSLSGRGAIIAARISTLTTLATNSNTRLTSDHINLLATTQ